MLSHVVSQFSHTSSQCVTFTLNSHSVCCHVCSYFTELQHSPLSKYRLVKFRHISTSLPVLFFVVNHQLLQFCHIHPSNVSHFLAFQVLYLSVHIPLPVQTSCSKSDSSELSARSAVVVWAASNDQPMSNEQPNEPQRDIKPVSFVTGAMLFLLVPLLFFCCCFCQQQ